MARSAFQSALRLTAAALYLVATFVFGTARPGDGAPLLNDKLLHLVGFAGMVLVSYPAMALASSRVAPALRGLPGQTRVVWATGLYATLVGAALEVVQSRLPYRRAEWGDLVANALGAALGCLFVIGALRWLSSTRA